MPPRQLLIYPDPGLGRIAEPVTVFDAALGSLVTDLTDTLIAVNGIGITAPHIGVFQRLFLLRMAKGLPIRTYVNPEITAMSEDRIRHTEGSISMPGFEEEVERARTVTVRYRDLFGVEQEDTVHDFEAVCIQHEVDQLNGIFWLNRLSRLKRERLAKKWDKTRRGR